jgi:hypothetical protein
MRYYGLDELPDVGPFVRPRPDEARERLVLHAHGDEVAVALELPATALAADEHELSLDARCQLVEGVSHFVLVAERARRELPTTELELELQAEIDKFVLLGVACDAPLAAPELGALRGRLFGRPCFLDPPGTERGDRYRMAHSVAARFTARLEHCYLLPGRHTEMQHALRRFYRAGQTGKLELALAA